MIGVSDLAITAGESAWFLSSPKYDIDRRILPGCDVGRFGSYLKTGCWIQIHVSTGIASAYTQYAGSGFTINLGITDGNTHKISFYLLDWDSFSRSQTITILDALTNAVLDAQTFSGFHNGQYASWNIKGNVIIRVTPSGFVSPSVSGIFFN